MDVMCLKHIQNMYKYDKGINVMKEHPHQSDCLKIPPHPQWIHSSSHGG